MPRALVRSRSEPQAHSSTSPCILFGNKERAEQESGREEKNARYRDQAANHRRLPAQGGRHRVDRSAGCAPVGANPRADRSPTPQPQGPCDTQRSVEAGRPAATIAPVLGERRHRSLPDSDWQARSPQITRYAAPGGAAFATWEPPHRRLSGFFPPEGRERSIVLCPRSMRWSWPAVR